MSTIEEFGELEKLSITVLVDNKTDLFLESTETISYFNDAPLMAEHGWSVLINLNDDEHNILWDAGLSQSALIDNMRNMKIDPKSIKKIALSHGDEDHIAALTDLLIQMNLDIESKDWPGAITGKDVEAWIDRQRIPLIVHPAAFQERWQKKEDDTLAGPFMPPPYQVWETLGAKIVLSETPYQLAPGCWATGYIPRNSFEQSGRSKRSFYRDGDQFLHNDLDDDQAIVMNIKDKGLIILSGCAHSGIVNTVNYAKEISGIDKIHAIIGGFHLARTGDEEIEQTVGSIIEMDVELIVPCHCTGSKANKLFERQMPEQYVEGIVGATYLF